MSTLNFQIISSPLTILTTTSTTTILPQNSKLVICSDELILKLKLKLDDSQEEFFNSNLLFDSPFFNFFKHYLRKVSFGFGYDCDCDCGWRKEESEMLIDFVLVDSE